MTNIVEALKKKPWPTWKAARPAHLPPPKWDSSPPAEPLSPVQERAPAPPQPPEDHGNDRDKLAVPGDHSAVSVVKGDKPSRRSTRRSRAGSVASSAVEGSRARTRSHSAVSRAESQPARSEASASASVKHVKDEPSTPAEYVDALSTPAETPVVSKTARQLRGTASSQAQTSSKRKRQRSASPPADDDDDHDSVPVYVAPRNDVVIGSRNFQRLSTVIMNDITTHKHAGPFQKPVREKDAEGYSDIIKRPQDLKSIKTAITAGVRAINAAAAKDSSTGSPAATPGGSSSKENGTIIVEKTADLVPPRAIVNSSQLEKEVMRMFANAVMFNPGEDGMVQDAREMADDIEAKVRDWRSAERQVEGRDEEDETAGVAASMASGPGKRRKL